MVYYWKIPRPSKIPSFSEHGAWLQAADTPRAYKAQMAPRVAESCNPDYEFSCGLGKTLAMPEIEEPTNARTPQA